MPPQIRYRCGQIITKSRFNTVYAATDSITGRELIIKETRVASHGNGSLGDPHLRLMSEGGMLRLLARRGILAPRYCDYFVAGNHAHLVMTKIPGQTLDALRHGSDFNRHQAAWIVAHLCLPVSELHRVGYVHHDIKPANIVVRPDGIPVLIDWGSAEPIRPPSDLRPRGTFTPAFVSPDQVRGTAQPSNDIFALGMTLDDLIQWPGPRLTRIISRAIASAGEPYPSAVALGRDLVQLSMLDGLVNRLGLMAI
jgi:serine/threonine-protein kinase